jgi:hypothetical protein
MGFIVIGLLYCTIADADGRLSGPDAVKFFSRSQLSRGDLKQVWAIADVKRQGFLGLKEFIAAMQASALSTLLLLTFSFISTGYSFYL